MSTTTPTTPNHQPERIQNMSMRILRMPEVRNKTGLSRATIYRKIESGDFPPQRRLSTRCVGWREADIDAWLNDRPLSHPDN
ncbi:prophage regulatory protein [Sphingomonas zeicaulis]|uniref:helix-turn-helix transcriptional regulator n=1 Tax=Sphingomonas zeicaulis TaxID=1632740 RepID=UPI003D2045C6